MATFLYTGAISVPSNTTIKAVGVAAGFLNSSVMTAAYTIQAATPVASPIAGTYPVSDEPMAVTLTTSTAGASIYYTLDGSTPTSGSTFYTGAISLSSNQTVKAIAVASGFVDSAVLVAAYAFSAYLISEDFEATTSSVPAPGWDVSGESSSINWHDTSAPLVGTASLSADGSNSVNGEFALGTPQDEVEVFFATSSVGSVGFYYNFELQQTDGTPVSYFGFWGPTSLRHTGSGFDNFPAETLASDTPYYIWLHYIKGSGSNAVEEVYFSTTPTKPGSPVSSVTTGTSTVQIGKIICAGPAGHATQWDYVRASTSSIGSNPS